MNTITDNEGWITQSAQNTHGPRVFFKKVPSHIFLQNHWEKWTDAQKQEWVNEHGEPTVSDLLKLLKSYSTK